MRKTLQMGYPFGETSLVLGSISSTCEMFELLFLRSSGEKVVFFTNQVRKVFRLVSQLGNLRASASESILAMRAIILE